MSSGVNSDGARTETRILGYPDRSVPRLTGTAAPEEETADAEALIRLSGLVQGTFARVADRNGLTSVQARLLCVLAEGPRTMAELARIFGVGKATLTGVVERAAQRGLTERSSVAGDRRVVQVELTECGRRLALEFHDEATQELAGLLTCLGPSERVAFREWAQTVARADGRSTAWGAPVL
ncbi:MarR family winged helix-turn-helix transcriptional regulator [Arthrobacter sp. NPDC058130]|uniref:MarR family winged helix-turn-helix transcriptional regulator n=1 Tax=Arthrobacter sp. NPDC058130 TaxID=3346353 RepID=UPI0036E9A324